ncbi:hypothetical protein AAFF_G00092190 [Aldrovandia affinis]|uniref:Uncharacterized protein n=1 Tax=Aldrovandia affinis TaxID=143900 RepID=A0AAD7T3C1_9TELE|nr:hypothetical protein AAFF_G00092190 [Aldrovandia affinis]
MASEELLPALRRFNLAEQKEDGQVLFCILVTLIPWEYPRSCQLKRRTFPRHNGRAGGLSVTELPAPESSTSPASPRNRNLCGLRLLDAARSLARRQMYWAFQKRAQVAVCVDDAMKRFIQWALCHSGLSWSLSRNTREAGLRGERKGSDSIYPDIHTEVSVCQTLPTSLITQARSPSTRVSRGAPLPRRIRMSPGIGTKVHADIIGLGGSIFQADGDNYDAQVSRQRTPADVRGPSSGG